MLFVCPSMDSLTASRCCSPPLPAFAGCPLVANTVSRYNGFPALTIQFYASTGDDFEALVFSYAYIRHSSNLPVAEHTYPHILEYVSPAPPSHSTDHKQSSIGISPQLRSLSASLYETLLGFNGALIPRYGHTNQIPWPPLDQQQFHYSLASSDDDVANLAGFHLAVSSSNLCRNTNQHLMYHVLSCTRDLWHWVTGCRHYSFPRSVVCRFLFSSFLHKLALCLSPLRTDILFYTVQTVLCAQCSAVLRQLPPHY